MYAATVSREFQAELFVAHCNDNNWQVRLQMIQFLAETLARQIYPVVDLSQQIGPNIHSPVKTFHFRTSPLSDQRLLPSSENDRLATPDDALVLGNNTSRIHVPV